MNVVKDFPEAGERLNIKGARRLYAALHGEPHRICGAWSRQYKRPCRGIPFRNGRCKNHGGLSTGPRTPEGKAKALACLNMKGLWWYGLKPGESRYGKTKR